MLAIGAAAAIFGCSPNLSSMARAASNTAPKPDVQVWQTECGACHMPYPPQLLPARSWRALMGNLSSHFSEDASLDPATAKKIEDLLVANAADTPAGGGEFMRGLSPSETPLRITDTPTWRAIHHRLLRPGVGTGPGIRTAANCLRCHGGAGGEDD